MQYLRQFDLIVGALKVPRSTTTDPKTYGDLKKTLHAITQRNGCTADRQTIASAEESFERVFDPLSLPHAKEIAHTEFSAHLLAIYRKMPPDDGAAALEFEIRIRNSSSNPTTTPQTLNYGL